MFVTALELQGPKIVQPTVHRDERGFFTEQFRVDWLEDLNLPREFVHENHSRSLPGVLRGLHYQHQPPQGKLVTVVRGRIWDVIVDLRPDSVTFGRCCCNELGDDTCRWLWIPPGFAHGFCVLGSEPADVFYKVDAPYNENGQGGIHWQDPDLAIPWPIRNPILSRRDSWLSNFAHYRVEPVAWPRDHETACLPVSIVGASEIAMRTGSADSRD